MSENELAKKYEVDIKKTSIVLDWRGNRRLIGH